MGRQHNPENAHLPQGVYYNKKGGTYYFRCKGQKDVRLGKRLTESLQAYWDLPGMVYQCNSMTDLISRYMSEISPTKATTTHKTNQPAARRLMAAFDEFSPRDVEPRHIYQYLDARKDAKTRANREVALLGAIFTEAVRWGVVGKSPVRGIKRYPEKPRSRLVENHEINAFFRYAPEWMRLYIELKLLTALRQWDMVRLHSGQWNPETGLWVDTSKTGKKIHFEATDDLRRVVSRILALAREKCRSKNIEPMQTPFFPSNRGTQFAEDGFRTAWNRAMRKAIAGGGLKEEERFREQDLRAKAASDCDSIFTAFELCGHNTISTTKRIYRRGFSHVSPGIGLRKG